MIVGIILIVIGIAALSNSSSSLLYALIGIGLIVLGVSTLSGEKTGGTNNPPKRDPSATPTVPLISTARIQQLSNHPMTKQIIRELLQNGCYVELDFNISSQQISGGANAPFELLANALCCRKQSNSYYSSDEGICFYSYSFRDNGYLPIDPNDQLSLLEAIRLSLPARDTYEIKCHYYENSHKIHHYSMSTSFYKNKRWNNTTKSWESLTRI